MTTQAAFTTEEWTLLRILPSLVCGGVSAADPSGIFGAIKEAAAGMTGMVKSLQQGSSLELLNAMLADRSMPGIPDSRTLLGEGSREQQIANLKAAVLTRVTEAVNLLSRKATPDEVQAYKQMVMGVAEKAANASKEGGFLGFGGVRVSADCGHAESMRPLQSAERFAFVGPYREKRGVDSHSALPLTGGQGIASIAPCPDRPVSICQTRCIISWCGESIDPPSFGTTRKEN